MISQITFDTAVTSGEGSELLVLPSAICSYLKYNNIYFKAFLYEVETERFSQAIWIIQQMHFKKFDQRLAAYLISAYENRNSNEITYAQEEIAGDVSSAREVAARMLRHFAKEELVEVKRGRIILLDVQGFRNIF